MIAWGGDGRESLIGVTSLGRTNNNNKQKLFYYETDLFTFLSWMLEVGSKRKATSFKDDEYYISSVPTNHVRCSIFLVIKPFCRCSFDLESLTS